MAHALGFAEISYTPFLLVDFFWGVLFVKKHSLWQMQIKMSVLLLIHQPEGVALGLQAEEVVNGPRLLHTLVTVVPSVKSPRAMLAQLTVKALLVD